MIVKPFILTFVIMSIECQPVEPRTFTSFPTMFAKDECIKEIKKVNDYLQRYNLGVLDINCEIYK